MKHCRSERRGGVGSALGGCLLLCFLLSWLEVVVGLARSPTVESAAVIVGFAIARQKFESCVVRRVRDFGVGGVVLFFGKGVDRAGPRAP